MPDFTVAQSNINSVHRAVTLLDKLKTAYSVCVELSDALALYASYSDTVFNSAIDSSFTASERAKLGDMLAQANSLTMAWRAGSGDLLGVEEDVT